MKTLFLFFSVLMTSSTYLFAQSVEQYVVSSKTLNMRNGAGKDYEVISTLSQGDAVTVIDKSENGWWYVDFNGRQGYVFAQLLVKDQNIAWKKRQYESGESPECENINPQYDYKLDNYLKVNVGSHTDVVIKLMKKQYSGDICIRIIFIRSTESYYLKNIPEGTYYLKIAYGSDWRQKIVDQQCYGKFMKNAQYEIGKDIIDFRVIHNNDGDRIPCFELSLDIIVSDRKESTFKSSDISEAEFNK